MKPTIRPVGVGDLKVVKQKLVRYEPGEVAHVENVLASEKRERQHRRLRQIEEIVVLEQEREEENRRDLQSTERFELQNETQRTIRSETSLEAGLELSMNFGAVFSLGAFARFASRQSKEESDQNSTRYAKEVTDRSLSRLVERVREERRMRTLEETEETNEHGFDNTDGDNITGVYRWVDKYYRAKVVNYGKRLMYEFIVPEPGVFYTFASQYNYQNRVLPAKPSEPVVPNTSTRLTPSAITRTNYLALVEQYRAQGVEPPPPDQIVVSKPISREIPSGDAHWAFANEDLDIPQGYKAHYGAYRVQYTWRTGEAQNTSGAILVGTNLIDIGNYPSLPFRGEMGRLPISGTGYGIRTFAIDIEVVCSLIPEFFERWRISTYNAIMNAYNRALMDYEERVAAAQIQQGGQVGGNNPLINREIEKEELKRACLVLWAGDALDNPPGISHTPSAPLPGSYPEIHRPNATANAQKTEFFEEAFDWKNITYELYPYFWGRKNTWVNLNALESNDPVFERFLKAGAARVAVPVRPSFTEVVLWYQLTGEIWLGGPVPPLGSTGDPDATLYNGYLKDMQGVEDVVDIDEDVNIPDDDPDAWMFRVPTTLVWLQPDSDLPDFEGP